jgi:uncharacterized protein (DUF885 family)
MFKSTLIVILIILSSCSIDQSEELHSIFNLEWQNRLKESPRAASSHGINDYNHLLMDMSLEAIKRRVDFAKEMLKKLKKLDLKSLNSDDQINYQIFESQMKHRIKEFEIKQYLIPIDGDSGFHTDFVGVHQSMPFISVKDYENYFSRLLAFPKLVEQQIEHMREGLNIGMTLPKVVLNGYEVTYRSHIVKNLAKSLFYSPLTKIPETFSDLEKSKILERGEAAIRKGAIRGYEIFDEFMTNEYVPRARESLGASNFPDGKAFYNYKVKYFTTLDITAEKVHDLGLKEVSRIKSEMMEIIRQVKFKGSFKEFLNFLRTDKQFYPKTAMELLLQANYLSKQMDGKLPQLFTRFPNMPYTVKPVPDHLAPKYTGGRYSGTSPGSKEPGEYWVNTYDLKSRPFYTLEALTYHEAMPGHHMQIMLNQELKKLPNFRRYSYLSVFGEGWALYSEWLGLEVGAYQDPYSNFGRLTYEMWRACRLVVDTGIHSKGWKRQQVIDYLANNTALSLLECTTETDRYIAWPGQALSYKMGELKIKELRKLAEKELGNRFDKRIFHDKILENGSIPLQILENVIVKWVEEKKLI